MVGTIQLAGKVNSSTRPQQMPTFSVSPTVAEDSLCVARSKSRSTLSQSSKVKPNFRRLSGKPTPLICLFRLRIRPSPTASSETCTSVLRASNHPLSSQVKSQIGKFWTSKFGLFNDVSYKFHSIIFDSKQLSHCRFFFQTRFLQ